MAIVNILQRFPAVVETIIKSHSRNKEMYPLQDAMLSFQMTWYWLKSANEELNTLSGETLTEETTEQLRVALMKSPTLLSWQEQVDFVISEMEIMTREITEFKIYNELPTTVTYKLDRSYDKTMEALFSMKIAKTTYEAQR